jgi:hypothetical protein
VETAAYNEPQSHTGGINGYKEDSREFDPLTQVTKEWLFFLFLKVFCVCKNHKAPLRNDNYSQEGPQYLCKFTRN